MMLLAWLIATVVAGLIALVAMGTTGRAAQLSPYARRTKGMALMPVLSAGIFVSVALPAWQAGLAAGGAAGLLPAAGCMAGGLVLLSRQWRFVQARKPVHWVVFHLTFSTALPPFLGTAAFGLVVARLGGL